jgi:hypothetical protein
MVPGEMSTPLDIKVGVPQGSVLALPLYSLYINDTPQTPRVYLAFFADDTCMYTVDRKEGYVLRKLQRGLISMESWCERWNMKITDDKTQTIYFSHRRRPVEVFLILKRRHIPLINNVEHLAIKVNVKLSLCFTKHQAMKAYWGSVCIAPRIIELDTRWR